MSGGWRTDLPASFPQTHFMGICDYCRTIESFASADARDHWEAHHEEHPGADDES